MAKSNVLETLKIKTFTKYHFWKLWWLYNDQNSSSDKQNFRGGVLKKKRHNYQSSVQNIEKVSDFDPKHPKSIEFWAQRSKSIVFGNEHSKGI